MQKYLSSLEAGRHHVKWEVSITDDAIKMLRTERGVSDEYIIHAKSVSDADAIKLNTIAVDLVPLFAEPVIIIRKEKRYECRTPLDFLQYFTEIARSGLYIQRFKGLGEMNADQLWDTTLNPETRTLLQVHIEDYEEAEEVFSVLMGDVVEPRRSFILENALKVENLDT
jgi:DNA gyrase subunit B